MFGEMKLRVVSLFKMAHNHLQAFSDCLRWTLTSRAEYDRFKQMDPSAMTDIQRSVRFYYLLRNTFASKLDFSSFNVATTKRPRINLLRIEEDLSDVHLRLSETYIENKHFEYIINRYGQKNDVFMYLDPPYYQCEDYYGKGIFSRDDFQKLAELLEQTPSKFILSINDAPEIRDVFKSFNIRTVHTTYSAGGADKKKTVQELLIMNYDPDTVELAYP